MDPKELRGLMEAYSEVYAPQEVDEEYIDEAEGSYGATPKAYSAASKTKMTAKRKPFLKKMLSRTNPANRTSPYGSPRKGMSDEDRERARAGSKHGVGTRQDHDYPSEGPGGVTKSAKKLRKQKALGEIGEGFDIFDVVLEFLQAEGFAETLEEAEWMMANMIDEEAIDIILGEASRADDTTRANIARYAGKKGISFEPGPNWDPSANRGRGAHLNPKQKEKQRRKALRQEEFVDEAQHARENPEKYEREQEKKTAPARGEKTPMPPRGDKRREDFEKWYAKQMGR